MDMYKIKVSCIMFFVFSIFVFQLGCAKKIETTKLSAGIEEKKDAEPIVKEDKIIDSSAKEEKEGVGEENISKDIIPTESSMPEGEGGQSPLVAESQAEVKGPEKEEPTIKPDETPLPAQDREIQVAKEEPEPTPETASVPDMEKETVLAPDKEIQVAKEEPETMPITTKEKSEDFGLKDIFFDFDRWVIKDEFMGILEKNAKYLISNPGFKVQIEGHADERGTNEYNLLLGEHRARSAMNFLVDMGVDKDRISIISYGEEKPFCREHDESCWSINRRGRFLVIE